MSVKYEKNFSPLSTLQTEMFKNNHGTGSRLDLKYFWRSWVICSSVSRICLTTWPETNRFHKLEFQGGQAAKDSHSSLSSDSPPDSG